MQSIEHPISYIHIASKCTLDNYFLVLEHSSKQYGPICNKNK